MWYFNKEHGVAVNLDRCGHIRKRNVRGAYVRTGDQEEVKDQFDIEYTIDGDYHEIRFDAPKERDEVFSEMCSALGRRQM